MIKTYLPGLWSASATICSSVARWFGTSFDAAYWRKDAKAQMTRFERFYSQFLWQDYEKADWALASDLWATRRVSGRPISDGDLLIAVFAINRSAILVTDNTKDFSGLHVSSENWR